MSDYWDISAGVEDFVGLLTLLNTVTYDLGVPLLFIFVPAFIYVNSAREKINALMNAGLYCVFSSVAFVILGLCAEYYILVSIIILAFTVFVKIVRDGGFSV